MFGFGFLCSLIGFSICFQSRERSQRKEEKQVFDLRWVYWLIAGIYTFYIGVFHYLANLPLSTNPLYVSVQERFWMQGFLIVSIFAGIGFSLLCIKFPRYSAWLRVCGVLCVVLQLMIMSPKVVLLTRNNDTLLQLGRSEIELLPENAIFLVFGDCQQNAAMYLQQALHERMDLDIVYLPYASYMWYNRTQLPLYPNITWPGTVYHELGNILKGEGGNAFNLKSDYAEK